MPARRAPTQVLPEFIAPQLATLVPAPPKGAGRVYEIKLDGWRLLQGVDDLLIELLNAASRIAGAFAPDG